MRYHARQIGVLLRRNSDRKPADTFWHNVLTSGVGVVISSRDRRLHCGATRSQFISANKPVLSNPCCDLDLNRGMPPKAAPQSLRPWVGPTQGLSAAGPQFESQGPSWSVAFCRHRSLCISTCYSSHASLKRNLPTWDTTPPERAESVPAPPPSNAIVDGSQRLRPSRAKVDDAYAVEERRRCPACMLRADSRVRGCRCPCDRAERASNLHCCRQRSCRRVLKSGVGRTREIGRVPWGAQSSVSMCSTRRRAAAASEIERCCESRALARVGCAASSCHVSPPLRPLGRRGTQVPSFAWFSAYALARH